MSRGRHRHPSSGARSARTGQGIGSSRVPADTKVVRVVLEVVQVDKIDLSPLFGLAANLRYLSLDLILMTLPLLTS